jgi:renalase
MSRKYPIDSSIIIGAGISGLLIARIFHERGISTVVLDKGRGVGGRMASRRFGIGPFDHGAQSFTVSDERFERVVEGLVNLGSARVWYNGIPDELDTVIRDRRVHYYGTNGMSHIPKSLAAGLNVLTEERVTEIGFESQMWKLNTATGGSFEAPALVMTAPMPQAVALLEESGIRLPEEAYRQLKLIRYYPCIALLISLKEQSRIPKPGGIALGGEPVKWISDSFTKGITDHPCGVIVHAGPEFSRENWDNDDKKIADFLIDKIRDYLMGEVLGFQVHRWLYCQPTVTHPERYLMLDEPAPLLFAGDGFGRASCSIEAAALSGIIGGEAFTEKHL